MKVLAPYGTASASGSVGSSTYARNRYGQYMRSKVVPVNPQTARQSAVRSAFQTLTALWPTLTDAQRAAWSTYGQNTPKTDVLGNTIIIPGKQWFLANNVQRIQAGLSVISDGPTLFGLPDLTLPVLTITAGDPISIAFTNTDSWAGEVGGALLLYASDAKSPMVNFCKGPYRYAGKIAGAGTPPTSPGTIAAPFAYVEGQRVYWRACAVTADGRVSADVFGNSFCGA